MAIAADRDRSAVARTMLVAIVLVLVALAAWAGLRTGVTVDNDTYALEDAFHRILQGGYAPSRTSGFPAYEFLGAAAWWLGGRTAAMALSILATLTALLLLIRPTRARSSWVGLVCWTALALSPLVLSNASSLMETSFVVLGVALLCWVLANYQGRRVQQVALALAAALIVLSRPDAVLVIVATIIALAMSSWPRGITSRAVIWLICGTVAALAVITLLSGALPFSQRFLQDESMLRRAIRAGFGIDTVFSPVGAIALFALVFVLVVAWVRRRGNWSVAGLSATLLDDPRFIASWVLMGLALYAARYVLLPDELEYLIPVTVIVAVAAPHLAGISRWATGFAVVSLFGLVSTSLFTVSLLDRASPWIDAPQIALGVNRGGFQQDLQARTATGVRKTPEYRALLATSTAEFSAGIESGTTVVLPRDEWHFLTNAGYADFYRGFDTVVGCDALTASTLIPPWRISQRAGEFADITAFDARSPMSCSIVATRQNGVLTPIAERAAH